MGILCLFHFALMAGILIPVIPNWQKMDTLPATMIVVFFVLATSVFLMEFVRALLSLRQGT